MSRVEKRVLFESIWYGLLNQALSVLAHASLSPSVPHFSRSPGHGCWSYNPQIEWRTNYREMPVSCGNFFPSNHGNNKLVKGRRATIESRCSGRASLRPSAIRRLRRLSHRRRCRQPPRLPGVWIAWHPGHGPFELVNSSRSVSGQSAGHGHCCHVFIVQSQSFKDCSLSGPCSLTVTFSLSRAVCVTIVFTFRMTTCCFANRKPRKQGMTKP